MFDIKSDEGFLLLHVRRVIFFIHGFVHGRPGSIDTDWATVVRLQGKLNHDCGEVSVRISRIIYGNYFIERMI